MAGRLEYLRAQKAAGMKVAAVWPARFPVELLWAWGYCAAEVWDPPSAPARAPAHLQPFVCSVVRGGFELLASGGTEVADLLAFAHTCDSLQNLATVVKDLLGETRPLLTFYPPKGVSAQRAQDYVLSQLRELWTALGGGAAPADADALKRAVAVGRRRDGLLRELYGRRAEARLDCTNAAFYEAVRGCEYLRPDEAAAGLESLLAAAGQRARSGPRLVLTGVLPTPKDLMGRLDEMGAVVAEDDFLACGRRFPRREVPGAADPLEELALRHVALPPCSTQAAGQEERVRFLCGLVESSRAQGVVFLSLKFCEPDLFERPALAQALKEKGIPVLLLETETGARTPAGVLTRLEAFLERLS